MKKCFTTIVVLGFLLSTISLWAQTNLAPTTAAKPIEGRVIVPETATPVSPTDANVPARPSRPERQELANDIKDKVNEFKAAREAYIKRQQELEKEAKGAADQERDRIRELIKDNRARWEEQRKRAQEEAKDRLREIQAENRSLREPLEEKRPPRPGLD